MPDKTHSNADEEEVNMPAKIQKTHEDPPYLELRGLAVGYNGKALIHGIELGVKRGEIVTLVGPNGSGKSTILKTITSQLERISGQALLSGKDLREYSRKELAEQMAVVLTGRLQTELMTCRDVAAMGRYPYTGRLGILSEQDERKVDEALAQVHAEHLAERSFDAVSDGERQRILLARAICQEPEIIVLDEPTSFLDIRHKLELLSILHRMAREQKITVVMSLHEVDLAMKISDRILCVRGEEIFACGTPEEVLSDEVIRELYDLDPACGTFDALTGSVELPVAGGSGACRPEGSGVPPCAVVFPEVLVISSGGTGIPVYRRLQREGVPFAAGILYRNDLDYRTAKRLAAEVVEEKPFEAIGDAAFGRAMELVRSCSAVINAGVTIGSCNRRMEEILRAAEELGKLRNEESLNECLCKALTSRS